MILGVGKHSNNAAAVWPPLMVTHPRCESPAMKKLNFLVLFLCPNASLMIWASQVLVKQVPCLDSMRMSSSLKSTVFLAFLYAISTSSPVKNDDW